MMYIASLLSKCLLEWNLCQAKLLILMRVVTILVKILTVCLIALLEVLS